MIVRCQETSGANSTKEDEERLLAGNEDITPTDGNKYKREEAVKRKIITKTVN